MNELKLFNFEGNKVRTILINDIPYFIANDVAKVLGYKNPSKATNDHCKKSIMRWGNDSLGRRQEFKAIPESDVYRLVIKSKLPGAEKFEKWVMEEVLPSIRKHGMYATEDLLDNPDLLIAMATELKQERAEKEAAQRQLKEQEHQVVFARSVEVSRNSVAVKILATILKQNGVDIGQNRMFQWLRANGYLIKRGAEYNNPTQYSIERGWFEIKKRTGVNPDGSTWASSTTKVTGKGQIYFVNKFLAEKKDIV